MAVVANLFCMRATLAPWRALAERTNTTLDWLTLCLKIFCTQYPTLYVANMHITTLHIANTYLKILQQQ